MRISDWSSDVCSSDLGIARAGWDRTGWGRRRHLGELWMRMRDRRAPLAVLVLATAYLALGAWGMGAALHWLTVIPPPPLAPLLHVLLSINAVLLAWRLVIRGRCTALAYGRRQALWPLPRPFVGQNRQT